MNHEKYTLLIHGGAGDILGLPEEMKISIKKSIHTILDTLKPLAESGSTAIELVTQAVSMLEDDINFNAGKGSVLNCEGEFELDASIMCGKTLNAGAVCSIQHFPNPIQIAAQILPIPEYVFLNGIGAEKFALERGFEKVDHSYFLIERRLKQLEEAQKQNSSFLTITSEDIQENKKLGTVGAVALDIHGNIAAATSTGGITNKKYGRIGDSPVIGAGTYADNETLAVSTTGYGEQFIRAGFAKFLSDYYFLTGSNIEKSGDMALYYLEEKFKGLGGFIAVNTKGEYTSNFNTSGLIHGVLSQDQKIVSLDQKLAKIN